MYSFKDLQKASRLKMDGKETKAAVIGNCSTQFFSAAVAGYCKLRGINISVFDADYNQVDEQLIDPDSDVYDFSPEYIIIFLASDKLYEEFLDLGTDDKEHFAENYISKIERYWNLAAKHSSARIIQPNFTEINDNALGSFSCKTSASFIFQLRKLNYLLSEKAAMYANVFTVDFLSLQIELGAENFRNAAFYYHAKMPIALPALPYAAKAVSDVISAISGNIKKCIITDLDNTLWGGIVGDDGPSNIEIGELGKGHVFTNLQKWLKQLKELGIILAVCSKNDEAAAKEPFISNSEMVLRLDDFSVFAANWDDKVSNIRLIQKTLNIGMNSIVFIDDNPFERNLVREMIPEIEVPELPEDPARYLDFLQSCNYFETASYTGAGSDRTKLYQAEFQRKKSEAEYESIDAYLASLEMVGTQHPFKPEEYSRIAQLSQRSNQFNLRTVRYTEDEIKRIAESDEYRTLSFSLRDKFGEHGLVAAVILKQTAPDTLFADTWFMSCRVLKRGMEEFIMNSLIGCAKAGGFSFVIGEYIPTKKNSQVKDIYPSMGFETYGENLYRIDVSKYSVKPTFIGEEQ